MVTTSEKIIDINTPEGEYYWVRCISETHQPMIAEKVKNGWFLTGSDLVYSSEKVCVIEGPLTIAVD